eukprot:jgi/Bigna1/72060/fgenesh1_pg.18_\
MDVLLLLLLLLLLSRWEAPGGLGDYTTSDERICDELGRKCPQLLLSIFMINGLVWTFVNLISCAVFLRWNLLVGIPDEFFVLGSQALMQMVLQFGWIPGVVLMSHLCHEGMEATMYAIMAGSQNLGSNISYFTGAYLLQLFQVQPSGAKDEADQFENLWIVAVIIYYLDTLAPNSKLCGIAHRNS